MNFITRPGGHTGQYWNNSIDYQILFFDKFFQEIKPGILDFGFSMLYLWYRIIK